MKKKMVATGGVVLVAALAGIGGWYVLHTRSSFADEARAAEEYRVRSQPVAVNFVVAAPPNTPADQKLYLSGSVPALGNWIASGVELRKGEDGKYHATVDNLLNTMDYAFKVTRGRWNTVEADAAGKDIPNRTFVATRDAKVEVQVADWIDDGKHDPSRVTMSPGVRVHADAITSDELSNKRTLIVFLPPDYEKNSDQRYPVLYMQDGQNLMDEATSYQGVEWGIDEAAHRLITSGQIKPVIIVGIYNSETRAAEFTPPLAGVANAKGDIYAKLVVDQIKSFIDERYRTQTDRAATLIGGGSMGGLIALYTAKQHNDKFGGVIALSPWLRVEDKPLVKDLVGDGSWLKQTALFIDMGTEAGHNYPGGAEPALADAQQLVAELEKAGLMQGRQFRYREIEGGQHNEASWAATIEGVLVDVFGKEPQRATTQTASR